MEHKHDVFLWRSEKYFQGTSGIGLLHAISPFHWFVVHIIFIYILCNRDEMGRVQLKSLFFSYIYIYIYI